MSDVSRAVTGPIDVVPPFLKFMLWTRIILAHHWPSAPSSDPTMELSCLWMQPVHSDCNQAYLLSSKAHTHSSKGASQKGTPMPPTPIRNSSSAAGQSHGP